MNERHRKGRRRVVTSGSLVLIALCACFVMGVASGCVFASFFRKEGGTQLLSYLDGYLALLSSGGETEVSLLSTFWEIGRWPLFAGLMGSTLLGVIALPALLIMRGFLLSYAVSVLICFYGGWHGFLLSAAIFAIPALCSVVSLFLIGWFVLSFHRHESNAAAGEGQRLRRKMILIIMFMVLLWILIGSIVQHWLSPALMARFVAAR